MVNSPNYLASPVGTGVRRLNRRPLIVVAVALCLACGTFAYTYQARLAEQRDTRDVAPVPLGTPAILKDAPITGLIQPRPTPRPELPAQPIAMPAAPPPLPLPEPAIVPAAPAPSRYAEAWQRYHEEVARRRQARAEATLEAARASTSVYQHAPSPARTGAANDASLSGDAAGNGRFGSLYQEEARRQRDLLRLGYSNDDDYRSVNGAEEKRAFLSDREPAPNSTHYLPGGREPPISPYEIKEGTIINATMISGINSDLPGQILGQVSEDIYDNATGRFVLIPQGSKLVGTYDNGITTGQERVLIAWTRIILPDSSSIDLGKMPGADQEGYAGLHDQVNNHYWKMFSSALMLSVLSAGIQISQGGQNPGANGLNAQQSIAAGLGQQFGQLGQEIARRNARIQPTLQIRPGFPFTVRVTKDMALRPWIAQ